MCDYQHFINNYLNYDSYHKIFGDFLSIKNENDHNISKDVLNYIKLIINSPNGIYDYDYNCHFDMCEYLAQITDKKFILFIHQSFKKKFNTRELKYLFNEILENVIYKLDWQHFLLDMIKFYIENFNINLNENQFDRNDVYCTPLLNAIDQNQVELIEYLISKGADVNLLDLKGERPLKRAQIWFNKEVIDVLIKNGAHL
jgi:hypothetical protein